MREWTSMRTLSSEAPPPPLLAPPEDFGLAGASWEQILRFVSEQTLKRTIFFPQFWQYLVQALFLGLWQGRPVLRSTITVVWAEWALLLGHLWHSVLAKLCNVYTFQIVLFTKGCSIFQEPQITSTTCLENFSQRQCLQKDPKSPHFVLGFATMKLD